MNTRPIILGLLALGFHGAQADDAQVSGTTAQQASQPTPTKGRGLTPDADCPISDPAQDYSKTFNIPVNAIDILTENVWLTAGKAAFLFSDKHSCGSMGCEYVLFEQVAGNWFRHLGDFHGHFKVLKTTHHNLADIEMNLKPDYAVGNIQTLYTFDAASGRYVATKKAK